MISFTGAEKKTERDSIFSYVEYKISLLKQIDGTQHFVMKRYRDLKSFFTEVTLYDFVAVCDNYDRRDAMNFEDN